MENEGILVQNSKISGITMDYRHREDENLFNCGREGFVLNRASAVQDIFVVNDTLEINEDTPLQSETENNVVPVNHFIVNQTYEQSSRSCRCLFDVCESKINLFRFAEHNFKSGSVPNAQASNHF